MEGSPHTSTSDIHANSSITFANCGKPSKREPTSPQQHPETQSHTQQQQCPQPQPQPKQQQHPTQQQQQQQQQPHAEQHKAFASSGPGNGGSYRLHNRASTNSAVIAASPFFHKEQESDGMLPRSKLEQLLQQLSLDSASTGSDTEEVVRVVTGDAPTLTFDQTMAIVSMLQSSLRPSTSCTSFKSDKQQHSSPQSVNYNMPLRRMLKQGYMVTGNVDQKDGAVISYLNKLQEHRRICVEERRYEEAKVTAERLASLRTQQVERLRQGLVTHQARELIEVNKVFTEETAKLDKLWKGRLKEYERSFAKSVDDFRALHEQQQQQLVEQLHGRMGKTRPSKEYLDHRRVEGRLALAKEYSRAAQAQLAAHHRRKADAEEAQLSLEAELTIRLAKLTAKQQVEMEALLQRGARGRDELELKRLNETEKKTLRFKNVIMELQSLHKLEIVQLENFLDAQVQAGKAIPLKDSEAYRRRREAFSVQEL